MMDLEKERDLVIQKLRAQTKELTEATMHLQSFFPLQTIQSMSERWGVARQTVNNWMLRHDDFPKATEGFLVHTARTPQVFSNADVLRYERNRGLAPSKID